MTERLPAEHPAYQVLVRTLGEHNAAKFVLSLEASSEANDWFEVSVKDNNIYIKGNTPIALSKGAYSYIKKNHFGVITWEGINVNIPSKLKDVDYPRITSSMPLRMYINPVTYGYSMAWWTWKRWEKELDWMAVHGINMPLALLGQEAIWQSVWEDMGIGRAKLQGYHTGPGFLPWFRMGNIYNHHGPLPQSWIERERQLQKRILRRMKALGMRPIVPAFSGHVPPYFKAVYPDSNTYRLENWGGLEKEKASLLLDPNDPLFTKVGGLFLKKYEAEYGKADLFLADSFNEMLPPVSKTHKNEELAQYGAAIYHSIKQHNPNATWVLQGWTFGHQSHFWQSDATRSFFSKIPKDKLLMLNYGEDRYPLWERLDAFYGFKWTYGYVHNYGGQQSLFGDMQFYYNAYRDLMDNPNKGQLSGYGVLPEAIENNSIAYEYIFDVPWGATEVPVKEWTYQYVVNRYGKITKNVKKAWEIALNNTYTVKEWSGITRKPAKKSEGVGNTLTGMIKKLVGPVFSTKKQHKHNSGSSIRLGYGTYLHNNRPLFKDINIDNYLGNPESIRQVLTLLLKDEHTYANSALYYYDIVDFAQHFTAYKADAHLLKASQFYQQNKFKRGDKEFEKSKALLAKLERLQVITGGSFTQWCEDAVQLANSDEEYKLYLRNAKAQITVWGGNRLKDYASKSWSGLLLNFYVPRWEMFFDHFKEAKGEFDQQSVRDKIEQWEKEWVSSPGIPKSPSIMTRPESIRLIKEIVKYH